VPLGEFMSALHVGPSEITGKPLKMIEKKLTHKHMEMYTWWCWHICKGGVGRAQAFLGK
jgi:hypothetical protein